MQRGVLPHEETLGPDHARDQGKGAQQEGRHEQGRAPAVAVIVLDILTDEPGRGDGRGQGKGSIDPQQGVPDRRLGGDEAARLDIEGVVRIVDRGVAAQKVAGLELGLDDGLIALFLDRVEAHHTGVGLVEGNPAAIGKRLRQPGRDVCSRDGLGTRGEGQARLALEPAVRKGGIQLVADLRPEALGALRVGIAEGGLISVHQRPIAYVAGDLPAALGPVPAGVACSPAVPARPDRVLRLGEGWRGRKGLLERRAADHDVAVGLARVDGREAAEGLGIGALRAHVVEVDAVEMAVCLGLQRAPAPEHGEGQGEQEDPGSKAADRNPPLPQVESPQDQADQAARGDKGQDPGGAFHDQVEVGQGEPREGRPGHQLAGRPVAPEVEAEVAGEDPQHEGQDHAAAVGSLEELVHEEDRHPEQDQVDAQAHADVAHERLEGTRCHDAGNHP